MCGISGYISKANLIANNGVVRTLQLMKRRGPNSQNFYKKSHNSKQLALLHTRLNIINLNNRANQSFYDKHFINDFDIRMIPNHMSKLIFSIISTKFFLEGGT